LSLSFVFSTTAQEVLGSCIFLFVKHPFDIGDRIDILDKSYVVERISLLFSVFRTVGDHRMTQVPNNILNSLWVDNFTRANAMHEQLTVPVSFDTSFAEIQALREEMELFVRDKENCRDFQQDIDIEVVGVGDMDKLELRVDIRHKSNWSNETVRAARRSKFMCALVLAMRKVPIRSPGAAAPEESKEEGGDEDNDKGDNADAGSTAGDRKSSQTTGFAAPAAATMNDSLYPNTAQATGFDQGRSSGTVSHRGSNALQREAAIAERLNARPPAADISREEESEGLYRTTTGASSQGRQSVHGTVTNNVPSRGLSTGHRKAGLRASYNDEQPPMPPPLSPVHGGMTPSTSNVPILSQPAPPGSRGSVRYEPPNQGPPHPITGSPEYDTYRRYYNQETGYEPTPVTGEGQPLSGMTDSSHYEVQDRYDPVSPPSIYSPQPTQPAAFTPTAQPQEHNNTNQRFSFISRTLKRGKGSKPQDEDEA
jgi:hypothetical protein